MASPERFENHGWGRYRPRIHHSEPRVEVQKPVRADAMTDTQKIEIIKASFRSQVKR